MSEWRTLYRSKDNSWIAYMRLQDSDLYINI